MSSRINPEAVEPFTTQSLELSDRNPMVTNPVGAGDGGPEPRPAASESRVTQPGKAPSADAGLFDYNSGRIANGVENWAERES